MLRLADVQGMVHANNPIIAAVVSVFLIILGVLVIVFPGLVSWIAGIGLVLAGVAVLASALLSGAPQRRGMST